MGAEGGEDALLADVCRTLARAGFDLACSGGAGHGLRVRRTADAVVIAWQPGTGLDPGHHEDRAHPGMYSALTHALTEILQQAGHAVHTDAETGDVQVKDEE